MKKALFLSIMILLSISVAFSQLGFKAGITLAKIGGDDSKMTVDPSAYDPILTGVPSFTLEPTTRVGFVAGISYKVDLILGLSIQPEVLYIQKGAVYETPSMDISAVVGVPGLLATAKQTTKLDYLEIPIMVKYSLPVPVISPYLEVGVSYGVLLSAKESIEITLSGVPGAQPPSVPDVDIKDEMNKSDLSLQFGLGVSLLIAEVDARYVMGLSKLDKDGNFKVYNRTIVLTAGIRLP